MCAQRQCFLGEASRSSHDACSGAIVIMSEALQVHKGSELMKTELLPLHESDCVGKRYVKGIINYR